MAGPVVVGLAGDLHDASSLDADRGQDPAVADALAQSFVASPLYVTARGLTTSAIPYGERAFQIDLDFIDHAWLLGFRSGDNVADVRPDIRVVFLKIFVRMFRQAFKKIDDVLSDCLVSRTRSMGRSQN